MVEISSRITIDPEQCGGRPCIRGMRVRVTGVLDLLASGLTPNQVYHALIRRPGQPAVEPEPFLDAVKVVVGPATLLTETVAAGLEDVQFGW